MLGSGSLPTVLIHDAFAVKEELSLESAVATLGKLDGRDKFTKIIQYASRFLVWWFATTDPALSQRASKLFRTTQRSRKAFRLLKILEEVVKLRQILRAGGRNASRGSIGAGYLGYTEALMSVRCLAMGAFWTFDNLSYLTMTDTVNFGVERAQRGFSRSWSVASALSIMLGIDSLRKTEKKQREVLSSYAAVARRRAAAPDQSGDGEGGEVHASLREGLEQANAEHFKSWLVVLKGVLDLTCAANAPGMELPKRLFGRKLNDGVIGAVGCASALCVLYNNWPARQRQKQEKKQQGGRPSQHQHQHEQEQSSHGAGVAAD